MKLPSTRELSKQLGISRTVVLLAYNYLLSEGFAVGSKGSVTRSGKPSQNVLEISVC